MEILVGPQQTAIEDFTYLIHPIATLPPFTDLTLQRVKLYGVNKIKLQLYGL